MFQSLSQSKVGLFANMLKKTVSGGLDEHQHNYSELTTRSLPENVLNKNPFLSDIFSVPGLTRLNQIGTGIIGVFLGVWLTFLMGTILVQLLFYKLFAVLFGLLMIVVSSIFILNVAVTPYDEASATRKLVAFIIFGLCIFCGLLCIFLYGTDWTENAKSIIVIHQDNYSTQTKSKLGKTGAQWKVLWTFLIGISIFFLIIYSSAEIITTGIFQCKCFSFLWYRRPTCNYVYFMACALFSSVIISSAFTLFISIQKDSNVSIDSLIGDSNPSYISLSNMLYGMLMLKQLYLVIPFGVIFGPILALVFQFNYLKDWVDYQNLRNENTHNGKGVLIKSSSLNLSDDDDSDDSDGPIDITRVTPEPSPSSFFDNQPPEISPNHKQITFKRTLHQNNSPSFAGGAAAATFSVIPSSVSSVSAAVTTGTATVQTGNSNNPLLNSPVQVNVIVEEHQQVETTRSTTNPLQDSLTTITEQDNIDFKDEDL